MSGIKESTIESPLEFYNQILFYNGITLIDESFYFPNPYTEGYKFYNEIGEFTGWIKKLPDYVEVLNSTTYFKKVLTANSAKTLLLLNEQIENLHKTSRIDFIETQLNHVESFLLKISKSPEIKYCATIEEELIKLTKDIFFKYNSLNIKHKIFDRINSSKNVMGSFFQCKEYPMSFYSNLYDITSRLQLIDDTETLESDFISVLTSTKPSNIESKIQFIKPNYIVSYYLRKIEPFFENLNFTSIEASKSFYNKKNYLLKANGLSAALSQGENKALSKKNDIDDALSILE